MTRPVAARCAVAGSRCRTRAPQRCRCARPEGPSAPGLGLLEGAVADPIARPRAKAGCLVAGVGKPASVEREAAAPDAFGEPELEAFELGDAPIDPRRPRPGETRPVAAARGAVRRQSGEFGVDLIERQPDPLGEDDERD